MTILIIPKILCRKVLQMYNFRHIMYSQTVHFYLWYIHIFFLLESLQTKIGGPVSSGTILNNALKYNQIGLSGYIGKNT